jgi:SAM-dependent methyltransferase
VSRTGDQFSSVAAAYAAQRPTYPDELFAYLSALCPRRELAWDCAAGSGQASVPLARVFRRVIATDASTAMLAQAGASPGLFYAAATAEASPLRSWSVDLVTVAQALHWMDAAEFYREVDRVLTSDGVLAVWTYGLQRLDEPALNRVLAEFYHETVGAYWAPERRHVESGYRTLPFPYPELPGPALEMRQRWSLRDLLGYIGTWSATQRAREVTGKDPVADLSKVLSPLWGASDGLRLVRWPLSLRVGRRPG